MAPRLFQASFHIVTFCIVAGQSIKYGLKGQEVKLRSQFQGHQQPDQILWYHNGNKVVEFDGSEQTLYSSFKDRTTLDWHSAELHLTGLRSEDSGEYELEIYQKRTRYSYIYNLQVIDKVTKPTITCETNTTDSSNTSGLLTCSTGQPGVAYEWLFYGNKQPGPQLRIFLASKLDERMYSCRVSNPLSNDTAVFTAKDCYSGESSIDLAVVLLIVFILLLLGAVLAAVLIYRRRQKGASSEVGRGGIEPSGTRQEGEGEELSVSVMEMQEPVIVQEPPVKYHRNNLELGNSNISLQIVSAHSQNNERVPLLHQPSDECAGLVSMQTEKKDHQGLKEPGRAETELSDPESSDPESSDRESSAEEPVAYADNNKEQLQTSPCSPDPPCAPPNDSVLASSDHDNGEQIQPSRLAPWVTEGPAGSEEENSDSDKDVNLQFNPPHASSPHKDSAIMVSKDATGEDREVILDQTMEDTTFKVAVEDADETGQPSKYWSFRDSSQFEAEEETRPTASSGETEINEQNKKENSTDSDDKENV